MPEISSSSSKRMVPRLKNMAINIVNHRETNAAITALLTIFTIYIILLAVFNRNIIHPLANDSTSLNLTDPYFGTSTSNQDSSQTLVLTVFSLFILWTCALVLGKLVSYIYLPPLLGMMLAGVLFTNVPFLQGLLSIDPSWNAILRQIAFILILIRCGIGLDPDALRNSLCICTSLGIGIISTTVEVVAIVLSAHFLFGIPVHITILFGYVLASTSPAVTVPTMVHHQQKGRGTHKGIPTVVLAGACIDNLYCIIAFSVGGSIIFSNRDNLPLAIMRVPVELLVGALLGILAGLLLRFFPRYDAHNSHFTRATLMLTTPVAFYFGSKAIDCNIAGPVAVIGCVVVAAKLWKLDNHKMTRPQERAYRILWDLAFLPFLFALIGLLFDFSIFTWELLDKSLAIIGIGIAARIISVFLIALFTNLNLKEKAFISFAFLPKATVQAALTPVLLQLMDGNDTFSELILQTCIISIILTAPIGQIILRVLGGAMLHQKVIHPEYGSTRIETYHHHTDSHLPKIVDVSAPPPTVKYIVPSGEVFSDEDNHLRLKVNSHSSHSDAMNHYYQRISTLPSTRQELPTFEAINHKAYEDFKKKRLAEQNAMGNGLNQIAPPQQQQQQHQRKSHTYEYDDREIGL